MISCQAFFKLEKNAPDSLLLCGVTCEYYLSKHRNFNRNPSLKRKKNLQNDSTTLLKKVFLPLFIRPIFSINVAKSLKMRLFLRISNHCVILKLNFRLQNFKLKWLKNITENAILPLLLSQSLQNQ